MTKRYTFFQRSLNYENEVNKYIGHMTDENFVTLGILIQQIKHLVLQPSEYKAKLHNQVVF